MDQLCDRDINECADFTHTCQPEKHEDGEVTPGGICTNMPGSYTCMCRDGFAGDQCTATPRNALPRHAPPRTHTHAHARTGMGTHLRGV